MSGRTDHRRPVPAVGARRATDTSRCHPRTQQATSPNRWSAHR